MKFYSTIGLGIDARVISQAFLVSLLPEDSFRRGTNIAGYGYNNCERMVGLITPVEP
jgi:hypothetical protein